MLAAELAAMRAAHASLRAEVSAMGPGAVSMLTTEEPTEPEAVDPFSLLAVDFAPSHVRPILDRSRASTVRWAVAEPVIARLAVGEHLRATCEACPGSPQHVSTLLVRKLETRACWQLDAELARVEGFDGPEALRAALQEVYPELNPEASLLTVVHFDRVWP